jgi:hypothetical protein
MKASIVIYNNMSKKICTVVRRVKMSKLKAGPFVRMFSKLSVFSCAILSL